MQYETFFQTFSEKIKKLHVKFTPANSVMETILEKVIIHSNFVHLKKKLQKFGSILQRKI